MNSLLSTNWVADEVWSGYKMIMLNFLEGQELGEMWKLMFYKNYKR